jgi:uncharacterized membrane protein
LVDHVILQVHHVVERLGLSIWDYTFLASGAVFDIAGWFIASGRSVDEESAALG